MGYTYEKDYAPRKEDGRCVPALAAWTEYLRRGEPELSLPEGLDADSYKKWSEEVKAKTKMLLCLPERMGFSQPRLLYSVQREGYRTEKWEFYPFESAAVPVLIEIPDEAGEGNPLPIVFCFPGAIHSKEFVAGEPFIDNPAAHFQKYPERNRMAQFYAQNGMISVTFDPISVGESAFVTESEDDHGIRARNEMIYGLLEYGWSFPGISVYEAECFMDFCLSLPFVDKNRVALSAHSLGTETALPLALIRGDIKALVFNDLVCDQRRRFQSVTETDTAFSGKGSDWAHVLPGKFRYFTYPDMLAALAPMYLALNEGGADVDIAKVERGYSIAGSNDRLQITHYPKYSEASVRPHRNEAIPRSGLTPEEFFRYTRTDAPDHSFRQEPSLRLLKKAFNL